MKRPKRALGAVTHTSRGFEYIEFQDRNGAKCTLQVSSIADHEQPGVSAVWLGPANAEPKILASQAAKLGIKTEETTGWVPYPIPEDVLLSTRAHLHREHVEALIAHLQAWLERGTFELPKEKS